MSHGACRGITEANFADPDTAVVQHAIADNAHSMSPSVVNNLSEGLPFEEVATAVHVVLHQPAKVATLFGGVLRKSLPWFGWLEVPPHVNADAHQVSHRRGLHLQVLIRKLCAFSVVEGLDDRTAELQGVKLLQHVLCLQCSRKQLHSESEVQSAQGWRHLDGCRLGIPIDSQTISYTSKHSGHLILHPAHAWKTHVQELPKHWFVVTRVALAGLTMRVEVPQPIRHPVQAAHHHCFCTTQRSWRRYGRAHQLCPSVTIVHHRTQLSKPREVLPVVDRQGKRYVNSARGQ
mmetsp:Transcript_21730/g.50792  ORF Transcript_21730/g.50792 Transcript_21730/m.50792 type:complete len:290 (+) Transcript_21730:700-1569(+)